MAAHEKWMPLYIGDYLADTMHLTTRQHGAYLLLLMHAWRNKACIPHSAEAQAAIVRTPLKEWLKDRDSVMQFFSEDPTGEGHYFHHQRVDKELSVAEAMTEQRSKAGKASAAKRERERQQTVNGNPTLAEHPLPPRTKPSPSPSPSQSSEAKASGADAPAKDQIFAECLPWANERQGSDCRSLIAKLMHAVGDDEALRLLRQMMAQTAIAPKDWIGRRIPKAEPREDWNQRRIREAREAIQ